MRTKAAPACVQQGRQHAGRVKCDECAIILLYCVVSGRVALFNGISHINLRSTPNGPTNRVACAEVNDNDVDSSVGSDCVPALTLALAPALTLCQSQLASELREHSSMVLPWSGESLGLLASAWNVGNDSGQNNHKLFYFDGS